MKISDRVKLCIIVSLAALLLLIVYKIPGNKLGDIVGEVVTDIVQDDVVKNEVQKTNA